MHIRVDLEYRVDEVISLWLEVRCVAFVWLGNSSHNCLLGPDLILFCNEEMVFFLLLSSEYLVIQIDIMKLADILEFID